MDFGVEEETHCVRGELGAILRHQLATPLYIGLAYLDPSEARRIEKQASTGDLLLTSLHDLLYSEAPPLTLLMAAKSYAKRSRLGCGAMLPKEVASVLYFASIAVALVRCQEPISSLSTERVLMGLGWSLGQTWLDAELRVLLKECRDMIAVAAVDESAEGSLCPDRAGMDNGVAV